MTVNVAHMIEPKSDQLNADDLIAGPKVIKVTGVVGNEGSEQPLSIHFEGDKGKPFKPGLSMRRVLVMLWGEDGEAYTGRSMRLYNDPEVKFGGVKVGGIRISHMSHIDGPKSLMLTKTRGKKAECRILPLTDDAKADAIASAEAAAKDGAEAFREFWNSPEGKQHRAELSPHIDKFKAIAAKAEEAKMTPTQRKVAEAKAKAQEAVDPKPDSVDPETKPVELEPDTESPDYQLGRDARAAGDARESCLYDKGQKLLDWQAGYDAEPEA